MAIDWNKIDKQVDVAGLQADVQSAAENGMTFKEVPKGQYEVKIQKMELTTSKEKQNPMFSAWFKVLTGEYEGSMIFMNQVITIGFQIHIVNEFLRSLGSGVNVEFKSYAQYAQMIMDVSEAIDGKFEYALNYGEKKGFGTFEIEEVFELEQ